MSRFFFFSSRRRHTRYWRDWSSDVCSSDLDNAQIAYFPGRIVSDTDDPVFTPREVELLSRPNVAAYVVTAERAARRFEALGVQRPWHVIPQGVSLAGLTDAAEIGRASGRGRV